MPNLLAPLLVGLAFQLLPFQETIGIAASSDLFQGLAELGVILLLFVVGLQIEPADLKKLSNHIVALTVLNLGFCSIMGFFVLTWFGYPPVTSALVATALATVAETTIAPILDELGVIKTRVASLILGPGVVDDVVEVLIASLASIMVGVKGKDAYPLTMVAGLATMFALTLLFQKIFVPLLCKKDRGCRSVQLFLLMAGTVSLFAAVSQAFNLGILLGAIIAGIVFQRFLKEIRVEENALVMLRAVAYGLLGPVFFFQIGYEVSLQSLASTALLSGWLLAANFAGKFLSVTVVGAVTHLNWREMATIGLGLSAKFSMGIIPVQIFYSAKLIDQNVFSSFVAVSAITTLIVPFTLGWIVARWKRDFVAQLA